MTQHHDDYATEPVLGLPEKLPPGEEILWQGSPSWTGLAIRALHVRPVIVWFLALMAYRMTAIWSETGDMAATFWATLAPLPLGLTAVGLLCLIAYIQARATVYTITNKRVVLRIGVALTKTINIPFQVIHTAAMRSDSSGNGDIALQLVEPNRIGFLHLWPHVRPWRLTRPEPSLRTIDNVAAAAEILSAAMRKAPHSEGIQIHAQATEASASIPRMGKAAITA